MNSLNVNWLCTPPLAVNKWEPAFNMAAAITREGKKGVVTDRPLDNLELLRFQQSTLAAIRSEIKDSRSKEMKE